MIEFKSLGWLKNVGFASSGNLIASLIGIISLPLVTRIYSPDVIGQLGIFVSALAIATPISTLMFPLAIPLAKNEYHAREISFLSLIFVVFLSLVVFLFLLLIDIFGDKFIENLYVEPYLYFFPLAIFVTGIHSILSQWIIRLKKFYINARISVINSFFVNIGKILLGISYPNIITLVLIQVIGFFGLSFQLLIGINKFANIKIPTFEYKSIRSHIHEFKHLPMFRCPQEILFNFSQAIPILMLGWLFASDLSAQYLIVVNTLLLPSIIVGKAFGDVLYSQMSERYLNNEKIVDLVANPTKILALIGLMPLIIIILFGEFLFPTIFGDEWFRAGEYSKYIAVFAFFNLLNKPTISAINVMKMQAWLFKWEVVNSFLKFFSIIAAYFYFKDDISMILAFTIVSSLSYLYLILKTISLAKCFNTNSDI